MSKKKATAPKIHMFTPDKEHYKAIIFSGGEFDGIPKGFDCKLWNDDIVICADGGYAHALSLGIKPHYVIGDFDSIDVTEIPDSVKKIVRPKSKDETDTVLAIQLARDTGCKEARIYGALGGRLDHTFANIQTLLYAETLGISAEILSRTELVSIQTEGTFEYNPPKWFNTLSVFALSDTAVVSLHGAKYQLLHETLKNSFPLGISNEIEEESVEITVYEGTILVIFTEVKK
jgi:thiamine pyrophosphokinase